MTKNFVFCHNLGCKKVASIQKNYGFSFDHVSKFCGVTARQLRYWTKVGLVKSSASPGRKTHQELRYNIRDIVTVLVIKDLRDKGLSLQKIRGAVERVKAIWGKDLPLAQLRVACLAQSVVFKKGGVYLDGLTGQQVIEAALEKVTHGMGSRRCGQTKRMVEVQQQVFLQKISEM